MVNGIAITQMSVQRKNWILGRLQHLACFLNVDINILTREIKYPVGTLCVFSCVEEIQKEFYLVITGL